MDDLGTIETTTALTMIQMVSFMWHPYPPTAPNSPPLTVHASLLLSGSHLRHLTPQSLSHVLSRCCVASLKHSLFELNVHSNKNLVNAALHQSVCMISLLIYVTVNVCNFASAVGY